MTYDIVRSHRIGLSLYRYNRNDSHFYEGVCKDDDEVNPDLIA